MIGVGLRPGELVWPTLDLSDEPMFRCIKNAIVNRFARQWGLPSQLGSREPISKGRILYTQEDRHTI